MTSATPFLRVTKRTVHHEESHWFSNALNVRLDAGYHALIAIVGPGGRGKSWAFLKLAEQYDPSYRAELLRERLIKTTMVPEFAKGILANRYPPRCWVGVDEGAETASAKKHQSNPNSMLRTISVTFRFLQIVVCWMTPDLEMLDKDQRRLIHLIMVMRDRGYAEVRKVGSDYIEKRWHFPIGFLRLGPPSDETLGVYRPLKESDFRENLQNRVERKYVT